MSDPVLPGGFGLVTAPTYDMVRPGDMLGLTRAFTPARRVEGVDCWRPVLAVESLPGDRVRVTVQGHTSTFPMTMAAAVPVVIGRERVVPCSVCKSTGPHDTYCPRQSGAFPDGTGR